MLPVADVIPSRTTPWVTFGLIALNLLVFLYELSLSPEGLSRLVAHTAFVPAEATWLTATTSLVVHENTLHVLLNVAALWIFGDNVEDQLGHGRYAAAYVTAGYAACLAEWWVAPGSFAPIVGASGAVAGLMGAYVVMFPRSRVLVLVPARSIVDAVELPALLFAGAWFGLQVLGGLGVVSEPWNSRTAAALWPTLGGFVAGAITGRLIRRPERRRVEWWGA